MNPVAPPPTAVDLSPLAALLLGGALLAAVPLAVVTWRSRGAGGRRGLAALTVLTLWLSFDLVVFGAFTRLTDSGLGCPDWPGCYGSASPVGAHAAIAQAQAVLPQGPVTHAKAWVEMTHRYLATAVGGLIVALALASVREARRDGVWRGAAWAGVTLLWVCLQGAFGALTVTLRLVPGIVAAHLLGGIGLLVLLSGQAQAHRPAPLRLSPGQQRGAWLVAALALLQIALGGWVSTNYAVLACSDFPTCQGQWWPPADFARGFTLWRGLGVDGDGAYLPFAALTAIHLAHRIGAAALLVALLLLAWRLQRAGDAPRRTWARRLAALAAWQLASGLGNVVLGWPLAAALAHSGGAALLAIALTALIVRARQARGARPAADPLAAATAVGAAVAPAGAAAFLK